MLETMIFFKVVLYFTLFIIRVDCVGFHRGGFRIVDGKKSEWYSESVVGFFFLEPNKVCTASIVSSRFAVSAVHCLRENGDPIYINSSCTSKLPLSMKEKIKYCKLLPNGDTRIRIWRRGAWIVRKSSDLTDPVLGFVHYIKYIYRPKGSYYGGEYNRRGGYDIMLLKLERGSIIHEYVGEELKIRKGSRVQLKIPTPDYQEDTEIMATAVGYGDSERTPCEVNRYGPSKFNYCGIENNCHNYLNGSCRIIFDYNGKKRKGCQSIPTPATKSRLCNKFVSAWGDKSILEDGDVALFRTAPNGTPIPLEHCFPTKPSQFGWCGTVSLTNLDKPDEISDIYASDFDIKSNKGWGFCTRHCSTAYKRRLDMDNSSGSGRIRSNKQYVLNHDYCYKDLYSRLYKGFRTNQFWHEPSILCFARNLTYSTKYFEFDGKNKTKKIDDPSEELMNAFGQYPQWYIAHPGICYGDSGGPLIQTIKTPGKRRGYLLLGIASKGQGIHGHCGGSRTLVHYVRIRAFSGWILSYIKNDPGLSVYPSYMPKETLQKFKKSKDKNKRRFYSWAKSFRNLKSSDESFSKTEGNDDEMGLEERLDHLSTKHKESLEMIQEYSDIIDTLTTVKTFK